MTELVITDVEAIHLSVPTSAEREDAPNDALIVRITTDGGIVGYGEVDSLPAVVKAVVEGPGSYSGLQCLREVLIGQEPFDTERLWDLMYRATLYYGRGGVAMQAMAGIDLALWDIKGKALGRPVHALLGGARRDRVQAYASHMFDRDATACARRAAAAVERGFSAVKFGWGPFGADPGLDEALVRGIRHAVGEEVELCVDAGLAWDAATAIERCRLLEPYDLFWLEEPLFPDDVSGYRELSEAVSTPIAAGEQECRLAGLLRLMDEGGIDVIQVDLTRVGLTQAVEVAALAAARGIRCSNHSYTTDINLAASLHFLASIENPSLLEYRVEDSPLRRGITRNRLEVIDGKIAVPEAPGLGVEVDLSRVSDLVVG